LNDENPRIRALALKQISKVGSEQLAGLKGKLTEMLSDPDAEVKRTAIKILKTINKASKKIEG